jgi:hypothetical protein
VPSSPLLIVWLALRSASCASVGTEAAHATRIRQSAPALTCMQTCTRGRNSSSTTSTPKFWPFRMWRLCTASDCLYSSRSLVCRSEFCTSLKKLCSSLFIRIRPCTRLKVTKRFWRSWGSLLCCFASLATGCARIGISYTTLTCLASSTNQRTSSNILAGTLLDGPSCSYHL